MFAVFVFTASHCFVVKQPLFDVKGVFDSLLNTSLNVSDNPDE